MELPRGTFFQSSIPFYTRKRPAPTDETQPERQTPAAPSVAAGQLGASKARKSVNPIKEAARLRREAKEQEKAERTQQNLHAKLGFVRATPARVVDYSDSDEEEDVPAPSARVASPEPMDVDTPAPMAEDDETSTRTSGKGKERDTTAESPVETDVPISENLTALLNAYLGDDMLQVNLYYEEGTARGASMLELFKGNYEPLKPKATHRSAAEVTALLEQEGLVRPTLFNENNTPTFTNDLLQGVLQTYEIPVRKKLLKKPPNDLELSETLTPYTLAFIRANENSPDALKIPNGFPNLGHNTVIPTYSPQYSNVPYDKEFWNKAASVALKDTRIPARARAEIFEAVGYLTKIINENYFGNGCISGQMGRFRKVLDVCDKIGKDKLPLMSQEAWDELMDKRYPLNEPPIDLLEPPAELIFKYENLRINQGDSTIPDVIKVSKDSDAGIQWSQGTQVVRRREVAGHSLDLANCMYYACKDIAIDIERKSLQGRALRDEIDHQLKTKFWPIFEPGLLYKIKPKAEVYARTEFTTKTRNIGVLNDYTQVPASILMLPTHSHNPTFLDKAGVWNAKGISLAHGGADRIIKHIRGTPDFIAVYADNVYLVVDGVWFSLDGEKMEATIRQPEVAMEFNRTVRKFKNRDMAWQIFAEHVAPKFVVNVIGVIGPYQIDTPYMVSGSQGTADFNGTKATIFANELLKLNGGRKIKLGPGGLPMHWEEAQRRAGVIFKVELSVNIREWFDDAPLLDYKKWDWLGYDFVHMGQLGLPDCYCAVLQQDRIYKSVAYMKSDVRRAKRKGKDHRIRLIKFFRMRALYLIGGWAHPGLAPIMQTMCAHWKKDAVNLMFDPKKELADLGALTNTEFPDALAEVVFSSYSVPTMYDVINLMMDDAGSTQRADSFALKVIRDHEAPWHFMSFDNYKRLVLANNLDMKKWPDAIVYRPTHASVLIEKVLPLDLAELERKAAKYQKATKERVEQGGFDAEEDIVLEHPENRTLAHLVATNLVNFTPAADQDIDITRISTAPVAISESVPAGPDPFRGNLPPNPKRRKVDKGTVHVFAKRFLAHFPAFDEPKVVTVVRPTGMDLDFLEPQKAPAFVFSMRLASLLKIPLDLAAKILNRTAWTVQFGELEDPVIRGALTPEALEAWRRDPQVQM